MIRFRASILVAGALGLGLGCGVLPSRAAPTPWPEGVDPTWYADPSDGDLLLLGGDLPHGNYSAGVRADGAMQHVAGRHFVSGDGWWALACRYDSCVLEPASLLAEEHAHRTYDGPDVPGQRLTLQPRYSGEIALQRSGGDPHSGVRPRRAEDSVILAAFKPVRTLSALALTRGTVTTWWYSHPRIGDADTPDPFSYQLLPAAEQQIRVGSAGIMTFRQHVAKEQGISELQLELELEGVRQSLGSHYVHMDDAGQPVELGEVIQWVGDLDGDGRPDLLVNHSGYYWDLVFWLSSLAQPGELVGKAGRFTYSPPDSPGC